MGDMETLKNAGNGKKTEEALRETKLRLDERIRELNCLYGLSNLVDKRGISLDEIFQGILDLIPPAMQYPEITCARITLEGAEFKTSRYEEAVWRCVTDIISHGEKIGSLEVGYLEVKPEWEHAPFRMEERTLLSVIAERMGKIVERKRAEAALFETEKRFRDLVENSITGISIIQNDQVIYQNPIQEKLFGPLPRKTKLVEIETIHPDDIEKVEDFYKNISSKMVRIQETDFRFYPPEKVGAGLDLKWVHCQASAIEYQGKSAILVNMMDVTRAKELETFLKIQDKMSSLGRVAAGIAHEIRNPLSGINIYLNTLEKIYDKEESLGKVRQILEMLQSASNKIESVIRRVMDFSKPSTPRLSPTGVNQPIIDAMGLASVTLRKRGIKIEPNLSEGLPMVYADPQLIEQVILNLITNAAEAMRNVDGAKQIEITSSADSHLILVRMSDSGPGVPLNLREKIFDPVYTTKTESTGIGLSLCHRIITDHGGSLSVSESRWGGAEFRIEIPIKKPKYPETETGRG
jgi:PAS domain S-box-containing protein